ncbi:MAG: HTH-type transcriptional regulator CysB [Gammaproteobacteria bacterium]
MNLQQLRYIYEVERSDLNISAAAEKLHTSQPGVSKQIRMLEAELGIEIFARNGKRLIAVTAPGRIVLNMARQILDGMKNIKQAVVEFSNEASGTLSIATTHTQARYALPKVIKTFTARYPQVSLHLEQGTPTHVAQMVASGEADVGIATEALTSFDNLVAMPCYEWNRCVIAPKDHPILAETPLSLETLASYPIITYNFAFAGRSLINKAFEARGLKPNVVLTALDSDVIKTYVELGLGIGLLANMAFDAERDRNLRAVDVGHLFESSTTSIAILRGSYLRGYVYSFIEMFAPHLTRKAVDAALGSKETG